MEKSWKRFRKHHSTLNLAPLSSLQNFKERSFVEWHYSKSSNEISQRFFSWWNIGWSLAIVQLDGVIKLHVRFPKGDIWSSGNIVPKNYVYINGDQANYADVFLWVTMDGESILLGFQCKNSAYHDIFCVFICFKDLCSRNQ